MGNLKIQKYTVRTQYAEIYEIFKVRSSLQYSAGETNFRPGLSVVFVAT